MGKWMVLVFFTVLCFPEKTVTSSSEDFFKNFLTEPLDQAQCDLMQLEVSAADSVMIIDDIPNLNGKWVSQDCEIRPGPEFLLRSYSFTKNYFFNLLQHFYEDESCFLPLYTVVARGRLVFKKPSWVTPSATESVYSLARVTIISHTTEASERLLRDIKRNCSDWTHRTWKPHREYVVYNQKKSSKLRTHYPERYMKKTRHKNINCLSAVGVEFNELMLVRTQTRPVHKDKKNRELLLGDIHSLREARFTYNPTAFQVPLLKTDYAYGCINCEIISKGNERSLPHLLSKPLLPPLPHGQWISQRCEVRTFGMFVTRRLSFDSRDRTWMGEYKFHANPLCTEVMFSVSASGKYILGPFHGKEQVFRKRKTGTHFNFEIQQASLTLFDPTLRDTFNAEPNCGVGPWYVGIAKDLSPTFGCSILGIVLPTTEYELIKLQIDNKGTPLLLMGLPNSEKKKNHERPTSYQGPLIQCSTLPQQNLLSNHIKPVSLGRRAPRFSSSKETWNVSSFCMLLLIISCFFNK